jgi:uncharacterized phage-associated protein
MSINSEPFQVKRGKKEMTETTKIIQALCYFLTKIKSADKLTLVKLLFLADKYHLIRYGRTITNDEYWAMSYGPVGTAAKDILSLDNDFLDEREYEYAKKKLKKVGKHIFEKGSSCDSDEFNMLSETDIEALDFILEKFGKMSEKDLIKYTHKYPEWKQYKNLFKRNETKRERIETAELLSVLKDDCLAMPPDHIERSSRILTGTYD